MLKARRAVRMLGGGMRQAGLIAAPAIVALDDPYPAHRRDHALARRLARGIAAIDARLVDVDRVQTNIVNCHLDRPDDIVRELGARCVLALSRGNRIRFVTHSQVGEASVDAAVDALADILTTHPSRSTPCRDSLPP
jgi:threonine aldolase